MSKTDDDIDAYVRERLADVDRDVLQALVEADSPLSTRARRALEYLDELEVEEGDQS